MNKVVLLLLDGLGDGHTRTGALGKAVTPNLTRMKQEHGICGAMLVLGKNIVPHSDNAHLVLFGYPLNKYYVGRGVYEALGAGMMLRPGDVAFRANFATLKDNDTVNANTNNIIFDRRAGRIDTKTAHKTAEQISKVKINDVNIFFKSTVEHRGVVLMRGKGLSCKISDTDPHRAGVRWNLCTAKVATNKKAVKTANIVNKYCDWVYQKLNSMPWTRKNMPKPNFILLRGAGQYKKVPTIKQRFNINAKCIAGGALYKGVARFVGMTTPDIKGATGEKNTNINAKVNAALKSLVKYNFVFLHLKATDSYSHDKDCKGKVSFIEKVDKYLPKLTSKADYIIITGDHSTPCTLGEHSADPVPFMLWGNDVDPDDCKFDDWNSKKGRLGIFYGKELMKSIASIIKM